MAWRLARSLVTLRDQINKQWPKRSKVSDGTIGDARHSARKSDHNPDKKRRVCAFDITNDPVNGPDLAKLIPLFLKDSRTKYVIFNRKIYNPSIRSGAARDYNGTNAHKQHLHLSVTQAGADDAKPWNIGVSKPMPPTAPEKPVEAPKPAPVSAAPKPAPVAPEPTVGLEQTINTPPDLAIPQEAAKFFQSLGWSKIQAVVLVANLLWESGGNTHKPPKLIWSARGDKDKNGNHQSFGAGQWNRKAGRFQQLDDFSKKRGANWQDGESQLAFLNHELCTTERKAGALLRASTTLEEAMAAAIQIWRPSIPHTDRRLAIARKLMDG